MSSLKDLEGEAGLVLPGGACLIQESAMFTLLVFRTTQAGSHRDHIEMYRGLQVGSRLDGHHYSENSHSTMPLEDVWCSSADIQTGP